MNKKNVILLAIIVIIGFFLRFIRIESSPPRLTHDEMSIGYNAYSILKTGKDEWKKFLPLDFEAFGDHKLPGYIYTAVPFIGVFGLNVVGLKIPSVLAGLMVIIGAFFIGKNLSKNLILGLVFAFIIATNPWPIHISRMALESNLALAFFTWGLVFLIKFANEKNHRLKIIFTVISGLLIGMTSYYYVAYRLISFLLVVGIILLGQLKQVNKRLSILFLLVFFVTILPLMPILFSKGGTARFSQVSIFSDKGMDMTILEQQNFCFITNPHILPKICRVIFNKPYLLTQTFTKNYLALISPKFLFLEGDKLEYLNNPFFGEFYIFLSIFYLIGAFFYFRKNDLKSNIIKLAFIISPIPSALAGDPQIVRASALLIFVALFSAKGFVETYNYFIALFSKNKQKFIFFFYWMIFVSLSIFCTLRYFISYNTIYAGKFETAFYHLPNEVVEFIHTNQDNYDLIYIDKNFPDAHIMIAFYEKLDPSWYQDNVFRPSSADGFGFSHPIKLGKYEFGDETINTFICDEKRNKTLYITRNLKQSPQWIFKDYSGVHDQAEAYDTALIRKLLIENNTFSLVCN